MKSFIMSWGGGNLIAIYNMPSHLHDNFMREFGWANRPGYMCDGFTIDKKYSALVIAWLESNDA